MKIATFNANSIRARLPIVLDWLAREKPDVLAVQETKVQDHEFPKEPFESAGWKVSFSGQKSYNGVAFLSPKPVDDFRIIGDPQVADYEARTICCRWKGVTIVNTYVPQGFMPDSPKFQKKLRFYKDLQTFFKKTIKPNEPALWLGDLNVAPTEIDLWDPVRNAEHVCFHPLAREALKETMGSLWIDLFRLQEKGPDHYTFWDYRQPSAFERNRGWRIDHILGTEAMVHRLKRIWIDKEPRKLERASDHTFLIAEFND